MLDVSQRKRVIDRVLFEMKSGLFPDKTLLKAIELAIDYVLEELGEKPDSSGRI